MPAVPSFLSNRPSTPEVAVLFELIIPVLFTTKPAVPFSCLIIVLPFVVVNSPAIAIPSTPSLVIYVLPLAA